MTPSTLSKSDSTHQKQPPAKVATACFAGCGPGVWAAATTIMATVMAVANAEQAATPIDLIIPVPWKAVLPAIWPLTYGPPSRQDTQLMSRSRGLRRVTQLQAADSRRAAGPAWLSRERAAAS